MNFRLKMFWNWLNGTQELAEEFEKKKKLHIAEANEVLGKIQKREKELITFLANGSYPDHWSILEDVEKRRNQWEQFSVKLEEVTLTSC